MQSLFSVEKAISITYSECVFVPFRVQHATVLYCHLFPAWLYHVFQQYLINGKIIGKKKVLEHKMSVSFFSTNFV